MSESLEENLEQKSRKEFKSRLKRGLVIVGLCASFVTIISKPTINFITLSYKA